jgi:hypothetical protein
MLRCGQGSCPYYQRGYYLFKDDFIRAWVVGFEKARPMPLQVQQQMLMQGPSTGLRQALLTALLSQNARTSLLRMTRFGY